MAIGRMGLKFKVKGQGQSVCATQIYSAACWVLIDGRDLEKRSARWLAVGVATVQR